MSSRQHVVYSLLRCHR